MLVLTTEDTLRVPECLRYGVNTPPAGAVKNQPLDDSLASRAAKSAHEINHEADQQNQAKPAAANDGTAKVKSASAEQEKQDHHE